MYRIVRLELPSAEDFSSKRRYSGATNERASSCQSHRSSGKSIRTIDIASFQIYVPQRALGKHIVSITTSHNISSEGSFDMRPINDHTVARHHDMDLHCKISVFPPRSSRQLF